MNNNTIKWLYLIVLAVIWGSSFILIKKALIGLTPYQLGALRIVITGFILIVLGYKRLKNISRIYWKWLIISGLLGSFFPAFFFAIAETQIDSVVASILNSLVPLNTIFLGILFFQISSTKRQFLGVVIGFIGTVFLILKGTNLNPDQNYFYSGFIIASTLMYAANVNIIKRHLQDLSPLTIAVGSFIFLILPALGILFYSNFFAEQTFTHPHFYSAVLYIILLSSFGTALAKILFNRLIHLSAPVFASSVTYVMPIVALFWGLLDGENFDIFQAMATSVIFFGVYLSQKKQRYK